MLFSSWLRNMKRAAPAARPRTQTPPRQRATLRPQLETLEDRCLLSTYSFTLIADNGPDSIFSLTSLNQPGLNDDGTVMFHSGLKTGPIGVFTVDSAGSLTTIARTDLLGATDMFLGGGITDEGTVRFGANLAGGGQAIFTGDGEELTRIADNSAGSPFSSFLAPAAPITNRETVAFRATLQSGVTGIFTERAGQTPHTLYVTGDQFSSLFQPIIQRHGDEASFRATLSSTGQGGVFMGDGDTTTTIATTGDTYSAFLGSVTINDKGTVSFIANLTAGGQAIVEGDGSELTTIADTSGPFSSFLGNTATINNGGQVVFAANLAAGSGIFIAQNGHVDEIIGTGDPLFGSTVTSFTANPFAPRGFNNAGELGFAANLADGRKVIVRADPLGSAPGVAPSEAAPQLVGAPIIWTATVPDAAPGLVYQFSVGAEGGPLQVLRDNDANQPVGNAGDTAPHGSSQTARAAMITAIDGVFAANGLAESTAETWALDPWFDGSAMLV